MSCSTNSCLVASQFRVYRLISTCTRRVKEQRCAVILIVWWWFLDRRPTVTMCLLVYLPVCLVLLLLVRFWPEKSVSLSGGAHVEHKVCVSTGKLGRARPHLRVGVSFPSVFVKPRTTQINIQSSGRAFFVAVHLVYDLCYFCIIWKFRL